MQVLKSQAPVMMEVRLSQSLKALQNRHLTSAQGLEKKKILGCWRVALPPANTPNPDFDKAMMMEARVFVKSRFLISSINVIRFRFFPQMAP